MSTLELNTSPETCLLSHWQTLAGALSAASLYYGHGSETAEDEAFWLLSHVLAIRPESLDLDQVVPLSSAQLAHLEELVEARIKTRQPLAYLLQSAWFAGLPFFVDERVLVPRSPIAELILTDFGPCLDTDKINRVLDLCTGSGCIALACAHYYPNWQLLGSDLSHQALAVARINQQALKLDNIDWYASDLFNDLSPQTFDLIISNPPYIPVAELAGLPQEYHYEPESAFAGGGDGLQLVHQILKEAPKFLAPDGHLLLEVGHLMEDLELSYPSLPIMWLECASGGLGIGLITAQDLSKLSQA